MTDDKTRSKRWLRKMATVRFRLECLESFDQQNTKMLKGITHRFVVKRNVCHLGKKRWTHPLIFCWCFSYVFSSPKNDGGGGENIKKTGKSTTITRTHMDESDGRSRKHVRPYISNQTYAAKAALLGQQPKDWHFLRATRMKKRRKERDKQKKMDIKKFTNQFSSCFFPQSVCVSFMLNPGPRQTRLLFRMNSLQVIV